MLVLGMLGSTGMAFGCCFMWILGVWDDYSLLSEILDAVLGTISDVLGT